MLCASSPFFGLKTVPVPSRGAHRHTARYDLSKFGLLRLFGSGVGFAFASPQQRHSRASGASQSVCGLWQPLPYRKRQTAGRVPRAQLQLITRRDLGCTKYEDAYSLHPDPLSLDCSSASCVRGPLSVAVADSRSGGWRPSAVARGWPEWDGLGIFLLACGPPLA